LYFYLFFGAFCQRFIYEYMDMDMGTLKMQEWKKQEWKNQE